MTGKHDDLPAFTAAIRQANFKQGGTVHAAENETYILNGKLNLLSDVHMQLAQPVRSTPHCASHPRPFFAMDRASQQETTFRASDAPYASGTTPRAHAVL